MDKRELAKKLTEKLLDKDYVQGHIRVGIRKKEEEDPDDLTRPCKFEGLETYLYIRHDMDESGTYPYTQPVRDVLRINDINPEEAWETAWENVRNEVRIRPLQEEMTAIAESEGFEIPEGTIPTMPELFIVTNEARLRGAVSILLDDAMETFAKERKIYRWVGCPSSIHEFLLFPLNFPSDLEDFSRMVREINKEDVEPEDQLADKAYLMEWGCDDGDDDRGVPESAE